MCVGVCVSLYREKKTCLIMTVLIVLCISRIPVKLECDITEQEDAANLSSQS